MSVKNNTRRSIPLWLWLTFSSVTRKCSIEEHRAEETDKASLGEWRDRWFTGRERKRKAPLGCIGENTHRHTHTRIFPNFLHSRKISEAITKPLEFHCHENSNISLTWYLIGHGSLFNKTVHLPYFNQLHFKWWCSKNQVVDILIWHPNSPSVRRKNCSPRC